MANLVSVAALGEILLHRAHKPSQEARRRVRSCPRRTSYAPSKQPPDRVRFEIHDDDPKPAVLAGTEALSSLRPHAPVLASGTGSEVIEAHVHVVEGRRVLVMLKARARLTSRQILVCGRRDLSSRAPHPSKETNSKDTQGSAS